MDLSTAASSSTNSSEGGNLVPNEPFDPVDYVNRALRPDRPFLGEIVRALEAGCEKLRKRSRVGILIENDRTALWTEFDRIFSSRVDYNFWRACLKPFFSDSYSSPEALQPVAYAQTVDDPIAYLIKWLKIPTPLEVRWSLIAIVGDYFLLLDRGNNDKLLPLIAIAEDIIHSFIGSDDNHKNGAIGVAALYCIKWCDKFKNNSSGDDISLEKFDKLDNTIRKHMFFVDPSWVPGRKVNFSKDRRARPVSPAKILLEIELVFNYMRMLLLKSFNKQSKFSRQIALKGYEYGLSSWYLSRKRRLSYERSLVNKSLDIGEWKKEYERWALLVTYTSKCGLYAEMARVAHYFLKILPDKIADQLNVDKLVRNLRLIQLIKQNCLSLPKRYSQIDLAPQRDISPVQHISTAALQRLYSVNPSSHLLHIHHSHEQMPENWREIYRYFENELNHGEYLDPYIVSRDFAKTISPDFVSLEAALSAFYISLYYSMLGYCLDIIERYELGRAELMDFLFAYKRTSQEAPIGQDPARSTAWRSRILANAVRIHSLAPLSTEDIFNINEFILGRMRLNQVKMPPKFADLFHNILLSTYDAEQVSELYDKDVDFQRRGVGIVSIGDLELSLPSDSAAVSFTIDSSTNTALISAIGSSGTRSSKLIAFDNLLEDLHQVRDNRSAWFEFEDAINKCDSIDAYQIGWQDGAIELFRCIRQISLVVSPNCHQIFLSFDGAFFDLPINHGLNCKEVRGDQSLCAMLVPNLSWLVFVRRERRAPYEGLQTFIGDSNDSVISELIDSLDCPGISPTPKSLSVVISHGNQSDRIGGLPLVEIKGESWSTPNDWRNALSADRVVLHSCHAGRTGEEIDNEVGRLPGLAFGSGVRTLLAPIKEVHISVAEILHKNIINYNPAITGYTKSISEDARVSIYNIYGNGCDSILL